MSDPFSLGEICNSSSGFSTSCTLRMLRNK